MDTILTKRFGLIAGDGDLPVRLAKSARRGGFKVVAISLSNDNRKELVNNCAKVYAYGPGEITKILNALHNENINQITFIGKVHKGMLLRNPKLDSLAWKLLREQKRLNDDAIMLLVVKELEKENISVMDQTIFLRELFSLKGVLGRNNPTEEQKQDIEYGFHLAKQMGKLDVGQSVVVQNKMILAVEAIEGTNKAIERGGKLGDGNAVVIKVSKPNQDKRFDVPTVGMSTLKTMKKFGAKVLAVEAGETFVVEREEMINFADKNGMVFTAV